MISYQSESMDKASQIINITEKQKKKKTQHNKERERYGDVLNQMNGLCSTNGLQNIKKEKNDLNLV